ncbi:MAG: hypothetical protein VYC39_05355 [Myxococcota bacterium]|nr:hypothetical protein [Myxococcota bacterium]
MNSIKKQLGVLIVFVCACSSNAPTYFSDVKPIIDARCVSCHSDGSIAPFNLDTYEEVRALAPAIQQAVTSRSMPPWLAKDADVKYRKDPSLSDEQIQIINDWITHGTLAGENKSDSVNMTADSDGLARVDLELSVPEPYTPKTRPDDYHCFAIPWTKESKTFVTGFNAIPGNPNIVHHIAVYLIPPSFVDQIKTWDAAEPGNGYTCFGGPSGAIESKIPTLLLSAWIPGRDAAVLPDNIGIAVEPGSYLALQIHYNSTTSDPKPDQTKLQFQLSNSVSKRAVYAPFLNIDWVFGNMLIPAGEKNVVHEIRDDPREFFELFIQDMDFSNGFKIHGLMFHMHTLGINGEVAILPQVKDSSTLLNIEKWDFDWQQEYFLEEPFSFKNGDLLKLSCTFDNSQSNQKCSDGKCREAKDVNWGEGTNDEMCVVNLLITEG